ncbi:TIGR04211 family SH3 domain-containing protein [Paraneptunicella aestuarii]|uniref:TIGR04211 family SH3 domain-containing protein n=1 Tax=Paraneptunicella aestuarii TaxID=2831148 RepID=UPI001E63606F|nr:TIGR04211 family SH3 domain-containing protein [Paraneptunicella aestuarii]UAA38114.1 TIGR04211 family SH3 domain-containing protein [Paraneptunicella aestuarii]
MLFQLIKRVSVLALLTVSMQSVGQSENDRANEPGTVKANSSANGEVRYITDELYTFLHAGPGRNFRILGSVQAGSKITQLDVDSDNNFVEIVDDKERRGWVDGRHVVAQETLHARLPVLEQQLAFSAEQLVSQQNKIDELSKLIESLEKSKTNIETQYNKLQQEHSQAQQQLSQNDSTEKKDWFMRGGMLSLAGVLLGVLLSLVLKRRRRQDSWM